MPKISVIIPVYKVEKYLERCVDSVRRQTLEDLEIILVDDGSPDNCPRMCDMFAQQDTRIQVIHKINGGLSSARNAGMRVATGDYIFFLDSDDWLELDGMELLYNTAEEYQVDFVRYRAIRSGWPGLPEHTPCMVEEVREMQGGFYDKNRMIKEVYPRLLITPQLTMGAIVGAWGSLYNRKFLIDNDLYFYEEVKFSEDLVFSAKVVRAAESFYYIESACVYHYFYNKESISKSFRAGRWESCKRTIAICEKIFGNAKDYDFSKQLLCMRWFCISLSLGERKYLTDSKSKKIYCKELLRDPLIKETELGFSKMSVSWKQKVIMILVKLGLSSVIARI